MGEPLEWEEWFYVEYWCRDPWTAAQVGPFSSYEHAVNAAKDATWATSFQVVKRFERVGA